MFHQFFAEKPEIPVKKTNQTKLNGIENNNLEDNKKLSSNHQITSTYKALEKLYPMSTHSIFNQAVVGAFTSLAVLPVKYLMTSLYKINYFPHPAYVTPKNIWRSCVVAPVKEEFIFRGLIQHGSKRAFEEIGMTERQAEISSIITSAAFFAAQHKRAQAVKFVSGVIYGGLSSIFDGSLWAPTVAHTAHNSTLMLASKAFKR